MISVRSRLQRLNGSRVWICILIFLASCSPKLRTPGPPAREPSVKEPVAEKEPVKRDIDHSIGLLLPFELNEIDVGKANLREIGKADLAIDFYQGFKLAVDSVSANGHNYKVHVFDTQSQETRMVNLAKAASVKENQLLIGPVFPDGIATFSEFADMDDSQLLVSPLAATIPGQVRNPNLVTVNNTIDQHSRKVAEFIARNYKPDDVNIVIINTKKTDDEKFAAPFRRYIKELSKGRFQINERPNAIGLQTHIKTGKINLVVLCSSDRQFILPIADRLTKLIAEGYKIELFGHPNWVKAGFLDPQRMQALKTRFSASYFIDYRAENTREFIARYRREYGLEPSEFAFKGFDIGYFFGRLVEKYGRNYAAHLTEESYKGLHNQFKFVKTDQGYINSELMMLAYKSFELQPVK